MIYHYTSIEILALILHYKKIRFNRLDQVDDILESSKFKSLNFSNYLFVSCWTENHEENISLWNMYTDKMGGVRIGLPNPPFKMKLVNASSTKVPINIRGEKYLPLTIDECYNEKFFIFPLFLNKDQFYKKIEYLEEDELRQRFEKLGSKQIDIDNKFKISAITADFALIKHKRWSFQEESRFVLLIFPPIKNHNDMNFFVNQIFNEVPLIISYYDMDLDPILLQEMEVTLGPNCSDADRFIVDSLLHKYGIKKNMVESKLKGILRFKK